MTERNSQFPDGSNFITQDVIGSLRLEIIHEIRRLGREVSQQGRMIHEMREIAFHPLYTYDRAIGESITREMHARRVMDPVSTMEPDSAMHLYATQDWSLFNQEDVTKAIRENKDWDK